MTFSRPTLPELRERISSDVASRLGIAALLARSVLAAISSALAGAMHGLHGHLAWLVSQFFPQTAGTEHLLRWADLRGVTRIPATYSSGLVSFSGQPTTPIPQGTVLLRVDGLLYETQAAATIPGPGTIDVAVESTTPGEIANAPEGTSLRPAASILGISSVALVAAGGLIGGADAESDDDLRARVLEIWRTPASGGTEADWERWTRLYPGVTRAWVVPRVLGPTTVGVLFALDDASYGPIPNSGDVALVRAHLEQFRPLNAELYVYAPTSRALDVSVRLTPDTAAIRLAVEENLQDLLRREASPGGRLLLSHIREAISLATGEEDSQVYQPTSDVVTAGGELLVFGTVTYL